MRAALVLFALFAPGLRADDPAAERLRAKVDLIREEIARPGSTVEFSSEEVNAWLREELGETARVAFGDHTMEISATVNLGPLWGERPVKLALRIESAGGKLAAFPLLAEIAGVPVNNTTLDLLLKTLLLPLYPKGKVNEPFALEHRMERIDVDPSGVRVKIAD